MIDAFVTAGLGLCPGDVITVADSHIKFPLNLVRKAHVDRYCVVLSNNMLCEKSPIILVAPMTSNTTVQSMAHIVIEPSAQNGLKVRSRVLLDQIQPIRKSSIHGKLGRFSDDEWERLMEKVVWNFDRG